MRKAAVLLVTIVMTVMLAGGFAFSEDSLQDLQAKAAKIKAGPDGNTEAQVKALMGEPKAIRTDEKLVGGRRMLKRRLLFYGPNEEILIVIDDEYGYVRAVK